MTRWKKCPLAQWSSSTRLALLWPSGAEAQAASANGAARVGCVIDGATRDLEALRDLDFPVFSKSVWSLAFPKRLEVVAKDVAITCCGVRVEPGDIVVADPDGVAVVPQSSMEQVKRQANRIREIEKEVKGRIAQGESMRDLFPRLAQKFDTD